MKIKHRVILLATITTGFGMRCSEQPTACRTNQGNISLQFKLLGLNITKDAESAKASGCTDGLHKECRFQNVLVRVLNSTREDTIASSDADINEQDSTFYCELKVPIGSNMLLEADVYEQFSDQSSFSPLGFRSWSGSHSPIVIDGVNPVTIEVEMFPVPISGRRVVLAYRSGMATNEKQLTLEISLLNLDFIKGVQLDIIYDNRFLGLPLTQVTARTEHFKIEAETLKQTSEQNYSIFRLLLFDERGSSILPIDENENSAPILFVNFSTAGAMPDAHAIRLQNAVVTDAKLKRYEVYLSRR